MSAISYSDADKIRKIGLRFKKQAAREWGCAIPGQEAQIELYDVESGKVIPTKTILFDTSGVQLTVTAEIFIAAIDTID